MKAASPSVRDLARRLVAREAECGQGAESTFDPALRAVDRLRVPMVRLTGVTGYRSLLSRALTLARVEAPWLNALHIEDDGALSGPGELSTHPPSPDNAEAAEGGTTLLAVMLGLLTTFVGDSLTLQLVRTAWPDATLEQTGFQEKEAMP